MKRELTADAIGTHERASATPARREAAQPVRTVRHAALPAALTLRAQQEWFSAMITTPESEPAPLDDASAAKLVTPGATLSALERLEIYRSAYHARLIECLADDYPVLQHALGAESFEATCREYIARHPSNGPSLNYFGRHMAELCRTRELPAFAADLAALEWAIVLAIHAPTRDTLKPEDLAQVPGERWAEARLVPNPSLRILQLDHGVNAYLQAFRLGQTPEEPRRERTAVAVYRTGTRIWRLALTPPMVVLFESLANDVPLGESLARVDPLLAGIDPAEAARQVSGWFRDGVASGLFSEVAL